MENIVTAVVKNLWRKNAEFHLNLPNTFQLTKINEHIFPIESRELLASTLPFIFSGYRLIFRESLMSLPSASLLPKILDILWNISETNIHKDCFSLLRKHHFSMMHAQFSALADLPIFYLRACLYMHLPAGTTQSVINNGNRMKVCLFSSAQFASSI